MSSLDIDRRTLLEAACVAGFTGLAGCSGGDGGDGEGDGGDGEGDGGDGEGDGGDGGDGGIEPSPSSTPCGVSVPSGLATRSGRLDLEELRSSTRELTQPKGVPLRSVGVTLHRRALEVVDRLREADAAPEWDDATLGERVFPFYRPDLEDPAYVEFQVGSVGSVLLSTGRHDFPVVHVNPLSPTLAARLTRRAEVPEDRVARFYRLDTLAFAAESPDEERVATLGRSLVRPVGVQPGALDGEPSLNSTSVHPAGEVPSDDRITEDTAYRVERSGPDQAPVTLERWGSWGELKRGYREVYRVQLEALRRAAAEDWEVYDRLREAGRGFSESYDLPLLYPDAEVERGERGTGLVAVERVSREGGQPVLRLVAEETVQSPVSFRLEVIYSNGVEEDLRFVLLPPEGRVAPPAKGASGLGAVPTVQAGGSGTSVWTAGTGSDQPQYHQFVHDGDCDVSSGAVAWAMLFAWADHQACLGSEYWFPRWGLFRTGAGEHPNGDADAPLSMTSASQAMMREIAEHLVSCDGLTLPSVMHNASTYLDNRTGTAFKWDSTASLFTSMEDLRDVVEGSISRSNGPTPVVVRTGLDLHGYSLAWKYKETDTSPGSESATFERKMYVNQGDADGSLDAWIPANPSAVGQICPESGDCL